MFVQATKSRRQNKTYVSYLVRESFRTSEGPRSRTVCNISALPPEVRDLVAAALSGQTCVVLEQIELSQALDYGGLAVLRDAWQRFGLEKLFAEVPQFRQRQLLQAMIFGRILFPCAKLALAVQASGTLLAAACGLCQRSETFDKDDLYEAMDALNGRWVPIEKKLYAEAFPQGVSLVLVLGNYKNLLAVEDAFCQIKSYMEVRPVFHYRPDRVRNHVRLCFIAYWLCAKLANEWRAKGETGEVQRRLRQLQGIRVGTLKIADQDSKRLLTQVPPKLNTVLSQLGLLPLFSQPPAWAEA